jgi:hypothetical protein
VPVTAPASPPPPLVVLRPSAATRTRRLRSPLLIALWVLLGFEALGGLVLFTARLALGSAPGEALHVLAGVVAVPVWMVYQVRHWSRLRPFHAGLDTWMGFLATGALALTNLTGLVLGAEWWRNRLARGIASAPPHPMLPALHLIGTMLVLSFLGAHLGAVLLREPARQTPG